MEEVPKGICFSCIYVFTLNNLLIYPLHFHSQWLHMTIIILIITITIIPISPDGRVYHSHDGLAPHSHEPIYSPGFFRRRAPPLLSRDFNERAFTVGIGGPVDNLAANFSRELADYIIYIIDVSGGDKIPRKGGPGITQADLLVCDLAPAVGADLAVMERDALKMRDGGPFVFAQI
ncbi:hypothetical protein Pint_10005 [Pistacia integerrima]|uniref:Uncharacterized protein n=1 Tax=Pistacia integerrima TaxID=434235 RepID=A0ACC0XLQ3_9ROSI|nr:hypothetical protein Pint_10005 [Pistacia integerrima]